MPAAGLVGGVELRWHPPDSGPEPSCKTHGCPLSAEAEDVRIGRPSLLQTQNNTKVVTQKQMLLELRRSQTTATLKSKKHSSKFLDMYRLGVVVGTSLNGPPVMFLQIGMRDLRKGLIHDICAERIIGSRRPKSKRARSGRLIRGETETPALAQPTDLRYSRHRPNRFLGSVPVTRSVGAADDGAPRQSPMHHEQRDETGSSSQLIENGVP